jgi:hypothetical protein
MAYTTILSIEEDNTSAVSSMRYQPATFCLTSNAVHVDCSFSFRPVVLSRHAR